VSSARIAASTRFTFEKGRGRLIREGDQRMMKTFQVGAFSLYNSTADVKGKRAERDMREDREEKGGQTE
jgi:hypothetical protein